MFQIRALCALIIIMDTTLVQSNLTHMVVLTQGLLSYGENKADGV